MSKKTTKKASVGKAIGIDLGTTFSAVEASLLLSQMQKETEQLHLLSV